MALQVHTVDQIENCQFGTSHIETHNISTTYTTCINHKHDSYKAIYTYHSLIVASGIVTHACCARYTTTNVIFIYNSTLCSLVLT